jgi:hypothetical protein
MENEPGVDVHVSEPESTPEPEPVTQTVVVESPTQPESENEPVVAPRDEALAEHRLHHEGMERHIDDRFNEVLDAFKGHSEAVLGKLDEHGHRLENLEGNSHVHEEPSESEGNAQSTLVTPTDVGGVVPGENKKANEHWLKKLGF